MNFDDRIKEEVFWINQCIQNQLPKESGFQKRIIESMNYSVEAGGKRIRPMLILESFRLCGGQDERIIEPFLAALECIHTYSLVHDDLPAMDNDEYRRGRKTTHVVYGEAMAILAGDGLLNYAFETALKAFDAINGLCETVKVPSYARVAKALQILSAKAGIYGMIGGQVIDMEEYEGNVSRERLDMMYNLKTGALIEASMMIGAVLAGAKDEEAKKIENIAGAVGLAFQIKDDILDVTSTPEMLGKPIHSDEKNEKTTYVSIMDLDSANNEVVLISKKATKAYYMLPYKNEFLEALIIMLINREK